MKQDFPNTMPHWEMLLRTSAMHTPGRKHQKRKGVKATQRAKNSAIRGAKFKKLKTDAFGEKVRAYWRGERDTNPAAA